MDCVRHQHTKVGGQLAVNSAWNSTGFILIIAESFLNADKVRIQIC